MRDFRIQRYNQTVQVAADSDTGLGADVTQLNGMLRSISVLAPALDGTNYVLYVLGQNGEHLYTSSTLTENARTTINSLATPICLNATPVLKVKSLATTDYTGVLTFANDGVLVDGQTITIGDVVYRIKATLAQANDILLEPSVAATAVLTSNNNNTLNNAQVVVVAKTYTFKTTLTEAKASGIVTSTANGIPTENDTTTIGSVVYRYRDTLAQVNDVKIGVDGETTLNNLRKTINLTGTEGVEYFAGQEIHPTVTAPSVAVLNVADYDLAIQAKTIGTAGNAIVLTESATNITVSGAGTLANGANAVVNEVLVGSDANDSLLNLRKAINASGTEGTHYSTGTTANADVTCGAVDGGAHTVTVTAIVAGTSGNALAKSEDSGNLDWDGAGAFLTGGSWGGDETLDNLVNAINAGAGSGTKYHAGTVANPYVTAGAVTAHAVTVTAVEGVEAGEDVATTETSTRLSWDDPTLTGGGEGTARDFVIDLYIER